MITSLMLPRKPMEMEYSINALPCKQTIRKWVQSSSLHLRCLLGLLSCFRLRDYISQRHAMKWSHVHQANRSKSLKSKTLFQNIQKIMQMYFSYFIVVRMWSFTHTIQAYVTHPHGQSYDYPTATLMTRFMGPTWGQSGADRTQVGPMLASWTLPSG